MSRFEVPEFMGHQRHDAIVVEGEAHIFAVECSCGTGLGLPISRRLAEMHGGRMWVESSGISGQGSTFHVELPLVAVFAEPVEKVTR